jgi:hypothetical protein
LRLPLRICGPNPVLCSSVVIASLSSFSPAATARCRAWATSSFSDGKISHLRPDGRQFLRAGGCLRPGRGPAALPETMDVGEALVGRRRSVDGVAPRDPEWSMSIVRDDPVAASVECHAIEQLIHRYSDAVTRADWDQHEGVFAADAIIEVASPFDFRAEGARAIREQTSAGSARLDFLIHRVDSVVVELLDADHAQATSTIHEMGRGPAPGLSGDQADTWLNWEQYAIYYDDIARIDGAWKFTHRYCQPLYYRSDAHPGQAIAARSALVRTDTFPPRN